MTQSNDDGAGFYREPFLVLDPGMHTAPIQSLDTDAAGSFLVTSSDDKTVCVWSADDGRRVRTIRIPSGPGNLGIISAVAISPDGNTIAAGGLTGNEAGSQSIYLFERTTGRQIGRIGGLPDQTCALAFSPDGRGLVAGMCGTAGVRLFNIQRRTGGK